MLTKEHRHRNDLGTALTFGRLVEIQNTTTKATVARSRYNALGHRIVHSWDANADATLDTYATIFSDRWQPVAVYRATGTLNNEVMDTHPKEQFVFHAAGLGGRGSASYIDSVAFRDKDTTAWTSTGRTPLDQRHYSLLNWRSDVVVIVTDAGTLVQHARYNDSGSPWGIPAGDVNGDGIVNTTDTGILLGAIGGAYVARYDLNLDGTVDAADHTIANNNLGDTLGHNALSLKPSSDVRGGHRLGYTGHTHADFNNALIVMRNRWYSGDLGRFVSRDPMGFVDGANVYAYARGNGVSGRDAMGLFKMPNHPKFGIGSTTCVAGIPGQPNPCAGGGGSGKNPVSLLLLQQPNPGQHTPSGWPAHWTMDPNCPPWLAQFVSDLVNPSGPYNATICDSLRNEILASSRQLHFTCPQGNCPSNYDSSTGQITICGLWQHSNPNSPAGQQIRQTILHEIIHYLQHSRGKLHSSCHGRVCNEVEAFWKASMCVNPSTGIINPNNQAPVVTANLPKAHCPGACQSSGAGGGLSGIFGSPCWHMSQQDCVQWCESNVSSCEMQ